eukprot:11051351-Ditylum_brightwellii.AAC.1
MGQRKNGTQDVLLDVAKDVSFWCHAYIDVVKKYNCTIHSATTDCLEYSWSGICFSSHQLISWDCGIYPHTHHPKTLEHRHDEGNYMGITNSNYLIK